MTLYLEMQRSPLTEAVDEVFSGPVVKIKKKEAASAFLPIIGLTMEKAKGLVGWSQKRRY
jgi:hypothetical protein